MLDVVVFKSFYKTAIRLFVWWMIFQPLAKRSAPPNPANVCPAGCSFARLCLREERGISEAVRLPAGAHTLHAVYFAELMAASLNQHVGG